MVQIEALLLPNGNSRAYFAEDISMEEIQVTFVTKKPTDLDDGGVYKGPEPEELLNQPVITNKQQQTDSSLTSTFI